MTGQRLTLRLILPLAALLVAALLLRRLRGVWSVAGQTADAVEEQLDALDPAARAATAAILARDALAAVRDQAKP